MPLSTCRAFDVHPTETTSAGHHLSSEAMHARRPTTSSSPGPHIYHDTTSQPRKGVVTGCQFGALGACPLVPGGCPHPTGWWGHPNHRQLPQEVPGTRDPTTARYIRCLHGAVGLGPEWRRAGLQSAQGRKHAANCNGGRGPDCRGCRACEAARLTMAYFRLRIFCIEAHQCAREEELL